MPHLLTRRTCVISMTAGAISSGTSAFAFPPFCRALKLANFGPPEMSIWADALQSEVRKRIAWQDGLTLFEGTSLVSPQEAAKGLAAGLFDMAILRGQAISSVAPDFVVLDDPRVGRAIAKSDDRLPNLSTQLSRAAERSGLILLGTAWNFDLLWARSNFGSINDLKGRRIRALGTQNQALIAETGATSIAMPAGDMIAALQTGSLDGAIISPGLLERSKLPAAWIVNFQDRFVLGQGYAMLINRETFNKADAKAQKAFLDAGQASDAIYKKSEEEMRTKIIEAQAKGGAKVLAVTTEELLGLTNRVIQRLDAQYTRLKISEETMKIVQSL